MDNLQSAVGALVHAAVHHDALAVGHPPLHIGRQIEPDHADTGAVRAFEPGGCHPPPTHPAHRPLVEPDETAFNCGRGAGLQLRKRRARAPVLVVQRKVEEKVGDGGDRALGERGGALGSHSAKSA